MINHQNFRTMKNFLLILSIPFLLLSFTIADQYLLDYKVSSDFTMKILGTSNVHDWVSNVEQIEGTANIDFGEDGMIEIKECAVKIPVESIVSTKGFIMDNKTMKALNSEDYPNITYNLTDFGVVTKTSTGFTTTTTGNLRIAGVTKTKNITITGKELRNGAIEITAKKALKMTDFGIDPPTALMGTMTTGDEVTIEFRIVLNQN